MSTIIKVVKSDKSWIESSAVEQLEKVSELRGMVRAVGLPDLHPGKTPVGACFITKGVIYPHIAGNDIGCGMALFSTDINRKKFKPQTVVKQLENMGRLEDFDGEVSRLDLELPFKEKLGTIGGGNHFAEFQEIEKVYDEKALEEIGISKGNILLLVHSGSRNYGEYILRSFIEKYSCQNGLDEGSEAFKAYVEEHERALEYARINRELVASRLLSHLNIRGGSKVLDSVHNSITPKECEGETQYIHRKGAAPSDVGYIVIAGSRGSRSYIVEPIGNLEEYGFSISHGAGRKWPRLSCRERLENLYSRKAVRENALSYNLVCSDKSLVYEEAPEAYKNIDRVIGDMVDEKMVRVIATLNPLVTYKG